MSGLCAGRPDMVGLAGDLASRIHRLDPRAKLLGLLAVTLVAVSAPPSRWLVYAGCGIALVGLAGAARVGPRVVWRRARLVLPLVLFVAAFVPFTRDGDVVWSLGPLEITDEGLATFGAVAAKATIGAVAAVLLAATTTFPDVLRGLERLRVPRSLLLIAAFMYRYLFLVVDEVQRMRASLAARGYRPRSLLGVGALGRLAAALFLRTYSRGERVYLGMLARGWTGKMPAASPLALARTDILFVAVLAGTLVALRVGVEL